MAVNQWVRGFRDRVIKASMAMAVAGFGMDFHGNARGQAQRAPEAILLERDLALVRSLRGIRDFDTALALLEKLSKDHPAQSSQIAFEQARVLVDQAAIESDPIFRERQRRQARQALEKVLASQPTAVQAAEAKVWLARVEMQLARAQLSRVLPLVPLPPENAAAQAEKSKARKALAESGKKLTDALAQARAAIQAVPQETGLADRLAPLMARGDLEVALSHFDSARTHNPQREADGRLAEVRKAQELLAGVKLSGDANPYASVASAYLGLLSRENGEPQKARQELRPLLVAFGPENAEARRLARVFNMEVLLRDGFDPTEKNPRTREQVVEELGFAWLSDYRRFSDSPEASHVRMLVAEAIVEQLRRVAKTPANQRLRDDRYAQIRRLVRDIERGDNEYTEKARRLKIAIMQDQGVFNRKLEDLKTFDDCLARAQYELVKMAEEVAEAKDSAVRRDVEQKRQENALGALRRGIPLALAASGREPGSSEELNQAKYTRVFLANALGLHDEAIQEGEAFARNDPRPSQAIMAGAVALQSHLSVMEDARRKIAGLDGMEKGGQKVEPAQRQAARKSLQDATAAMVRFADYLAKRWPEEELANTCRFQIGLAHIRSGKYADALPVLTAIPKESRSKPPALMQSALIHYQLAEGMSADPSAKAAEAAKAVELLKQIPPLADVIDKGLTDNFLQSRLRLASEYYGGKNFQALSGVLAELDGVRARLDDESRNAYGALFQRADLYSVVLAMTRANEAKDPAAQADILDQGVARLAKAKSSLNAKPTVASFLEKALTAAVVANRPEMSARVVATGVELAGSPPQDEDCQNLARVLLSSSRRALSSGLSPMDGQREERSAHLSAVLAKVPETILTGDATRRLLANAHETVGGAGKDGAREFEKALKILEPVAKPLLEKPTELQGAREKQVLVVNYLRLLRLTGQLELERAQLTKATEAGGWGVRSLDVALEDIQALIAEKKFGLATRKVKPIADQLETKIQGVGPNPNQADRSIVDRYTEAVALQIIAYEGYGRANKDSQSSKKAAALMADLEKRPWYQQAPDFWIRRLTRLATESPEFKENCEKFRKGK